MSLDTSFGQWLKQRRKARGLAQGELAQQVGCATITLQKIEAGKRRPSRQIAERLAAALDIRAHAGPSFIDFARSRSAVDRPDRPFRAPNNLATPSTPLIGREHDAEAALKQLMRHDTRLLNLVGPPGIGKTRLALQIAANACDEFDDGAFFVPLAPIADPDLVLPNIGQVLKLNEISSRPWLDRLSDYLQLKRMLLVLDNFEQVLHAAPLVGKLLTACPLLKVMVTSRTALRVRAERLFRVPALALPDLARLSTVARLTEYAAVAMFVDRAQAVAPDFKINEVNALAVACICHRLDGLPLALELIATRVQVLPPQALLERLSGSLLLRSDSLHDLDERQRTLSHAIAWSHNLLAPAERRLFRRLGVFVDGWTLEAAERISTDNDLDARGTSIASDSDWLPASGLLDMMTSLVNQSMVVRQVHEGEIRFTFLETIREYALEQLEANDEAPSLKRRHAQYFLSLAQDAAPHFNRAGEAQWLRRLDRERDNLRAALEWAYNRAGATQLLGELALAFANYAWNGNLLNESRDWLERAFRLTEGQDIPPLAQVHLLNTLGPNAYLRGDYASAQQYLEKALALAKTLKDVNEIAFSLFNLALATHNMGDHERAEALWRTVLTLAQESGNRWIEGMTLGNLGDIAQLHGDSAHAIQLYEEGIRHLCDIGDALFTALMRNYLGAVLRRQGRIAEAEAMHLECLRTVYEVGNVREVSVSLEKLAGVADAQGDAVRTARLLSAAGTFRQQSSAPVEASQKTDYDQILASTTAQLDSAVFAAAWAEGRAMSLEQAVAYALDVSG